MVNCSSVLVSPHAGCTKDLMWLQNAMRLKQSIKSCAFNKEQRITDSLRLKECDLNWWNKMLYVRIKDYLKTAESS